MNTVKSIKEFCKAYAPYNYANEFWIGWHAANYAIACPYPKGPKATAWHAGVEAREDWEASNEEHSLR